MYFTILYTQANLASVGTIYKVRAELHPRSAGSASPRAPRWKLGEIRMQDLDTKEVLKFKANGWLGNKRDLMYEIAAVRPGKPVLSGTCYNKL